jgi:twinkle protein
MTPHEFAQIYLQPFNIKGDEIVPDRCPFCHGGDGGKDKHTFALNIVNQTYNCKRGSCGRQGHFTQLCKEFGVSTDKDTFQPPKKTYKKPSKKPQSLHDAALGYLKLRGISKATADAYRVGTDESGNLMFPYYDGSGEHVFNKYRPAHKLKPGERKAWRDEGTMPVLYGMWKCDPALPLTLVEGEADAMACHEAGIPNAVSVPSGAEDFTWLDTCWEWLGQFNAIYLYGDNDAAGMGMINKLRVKLSNHRLFVVEHEFKDANELLHRRGPGAVRAAYDAAVEMPVEGLFNLANVVPLDVSNIPAVNSSIKELNKDLGGFLMGDVTIWTGERANGKSTVVSMQMLDAIEQGFNVCAYSGELQASRFQYWTDLQAAGAANVQSYYDHTRERTVYYVPQDVKSKIHKWYDRKYWLYDNKIAMENEEISILNRFELAAKRFDCRVFMIDNLMCADFGRMTDKDFYRSQSRFVGQLVSFASKHNAHVHLVAHPRKTNGKDINNDDVSGSGDVTNRAANVILVKRKDNDAAVDLTLEIKKNRWEGTNGAYGLRYCKTSRRVYQPAVGNTLKYGWENISAEPEPNFPLLPF